LEYVFNQRFVMGINVEAATGPSAISSRAGVRPAEITPTKTPSAYLTNESNLPKAKTAIVNRKPDTRGLVDKTA
jgi:hypothetical protein